MSSIAQLESQLAEIFAGDNFEVDGAGSPVDIDITDGVREIRTDLAATAMTRPSGKG
ncbi:hypothetical protein ACFO6V_19825 [Promicromonospora alba]|jgi:hypothetical protein|uniref:Uncharacterized protein n=1 Tax=Promicromonospora alba TaxID=1616110 RepID=A0ABV9HKM9_9MICO